MTDDREAAEAKFTKSERERSRLAIVPRKPRTSGP